MNNERGFILPLTIILLFLLSSTLFHQISVYEREKRFHAEIEQQFYIQQLLQMATADILSEIEREAPLISGQFNYDIGNAYYWLLAEEEQFVHIDLNVITTNNKQRNVEIVFDKNHLVVVDWLEKINF